MSISSLSRFSVPLATNQSASNQGMLMPKLKYRFRVTFDQFGISGPETVELTKQVKNFKRPSPTFDPIQVHTYNSVVNLLGKPKWENTTCTLRDDASGNVARLVGEQMQKQFDFMEQSSAASGYDYKFVTRLELLDGGNGQFEPAILETWEMYGCLISGADYGEMDYGTNDPVEISLTIMYDNALQIPLGDGIGTNVGRTQNWTAL